MTVTWKKLAYRADMLPDLLSPYAVGDLLYANSTTTIAKLADVAVGSYLRSGGVGAVPAWATLNQAAVAGLLSTDGPSFAHLHLADVAAIYTAAESWIGPSSTAGIYFKGGFVGIGTVTPVTNLDVYTPSGYGGLSVFDGYYRYSIGIGPKAEAGPNANFFAMYKSSSEMCFDTSPAAAYNFYIAGAFKVIIDPTGNVGIGIASFGTSAAKVLGMGSGTAPSSFPADMAQMCVKDQAAGNACVHFYTELGQIIKLYQQAHVANPTDLATCITAITSILTRLENLGFNATA